MARMSDQLAESRPRTNVPGSYQPLVPVAAAVAGGIVCDRLADLPPAVWLAAAVCCLVCWLLLYRARYHGAGALVLLVGVAACAGTWHQLRWNYFRYDEVGRFAGPVQQPVCLEGVAIGSPRYTPPPPANPLRMLPATATTYLEVRVLAVRDGTVWRSASGRARLVVAGQLLGVVHGDRLRIFANLAKVSPAQNPGQFDRRWHARSHRRLARLRTSWPDCVTVLHRGSRWDPFCWPSHLRIQAHRLLDRHIGPRQAALASGVLLGAREQVDPDLHEAFFVTGTVHLLAISGLHVGMVALVFYWLFRRLVGSQQRALAMVAALVVLYALLAQARPPVVRAAVLVLVYCLARFSGRVPLPGNSLAAALLVVLAANPADLFRTGVQLSFLAAGVIFTVMAVWPPRQQLDPLDRIVQESKPRWLRLLGWLAALCGRTLLVSILLWLVLLPLIVARFHIVAWIAPLVGLLIWIPMAAAVVCGLLLLITGWLLPPVAAVFGYLCGVALGIVQLGLNWGQQIPGNPLWVPGPAEWWLAGFYGMVAVYGLMPSLRTRRMLWAAALSAWIAAGWAAWPRPNTHGALHCTFLAVGHGCAAVVQTPSGGVLLFDAGCLGDPRWAASDLAKFLWLQGYTRVDRIILSHADADHYNMVPYLLGRFAVEGIVVGPSMFRQTSPALGALRRALAEAGVPVLRCSAGSTLWNEPGCALRVLHPPEKWPPHSDNAASLVVKVDARGRSILLTGDIEPPGLDLLLTRTDGACDVLLAPHHGSRRSNPPGLTAWCQPEVVILSGAAGDQYSETAATCKAAGIDVFHTARSGAIGVIVDGETLRIQTYRRN